MAPFVGFSQLEGEARSVLELLTDTTENLKPSQLQEQIEAGEKQCKEALDDHYISMRLIRESIIDLLSTSENKVAKIESRREEEIKRLEKNQEELSAKQRIAREAEDEFESADKALEVVTNEIEAMSEKDSGASETRAKEHPVLTARQKLLYCITRITWDEKKRKNDDPQVRLVRGYVVDPIKNDVSVFNVDTNQLSSVTSCQFFWDYIGASGISKKWKKI